MDGLRARHLRRAGAVPQQGRLGLTALSSVVWNNANSYILIAVPMFLLMGEIILRSGVSSYFYRGVAVLMGRLPGGLLHANIASCAVFSAVSRLERRHRGHGRHRGHSRDAGAAATSPARVFGSLAAGGTLGILIPPSIVMVLYGALVEELVARLFMAGILPGLLMAGIFMIFIAVLLLVKPHYAPPRRRRPASRRAERSDACLSRPRPAGRGAGQHLLRHRHADRGRPRWARPAPSRWRSAIAASRARCSPNR